MASNQLILRNLERQLLESDKEMWLTILKFNDLTISLTDLFRLVKTLVLFLIKFCPPQEFHHILSCSSDEGGWNTNHCQGSWESVKWWWAEREREKFIKIKNLLLDNCLFCPLGCWSRNRSHKLCTTQCFTGLKEEGWLMTSYLHQKIRSDPLGEVYR